MEVIQICISYIYRFYKDQFVPKYKVVFKREYDKNAHRNVSITNPSPYMSSFSIAIMLVIGGEILFLLFLIDKRKNKD